MLYQLAVIPDSCIAKDILSWYNSLYSELSEANTCAYRNYENETIPLEVIEDQLKSLDSDTLFDLFEQALRALLPVVPPPIFNLAFAFLRAVVNNLF